MDYSAIAAAIAAAIFWYRGAEMEKVSPLLWVGPSIAISAVIIGLGKGWIAIALGQVALIVGITLYRTLTDKKDSP